MFRGVRAAKFNNSRFNIFLRNNEESNPPQNSVPDMTNQGVVDNIRRADHEVYYYQLLVQKRGSPLWQPGPNMKLHVDYRRTGVRIGDVCIINTLEGRFEFLFNIYLDSDHPIQRGVVPEGFEPLQPTQFEGDLEETIIYGANSYLASSSLNKTKNVNSSGLKFNTSAREAAILIMPDGAVTHNLLNHQPVREYFARHVDSWCEYATRIRGRTIDNGDIRVVIGCDKVSAWGIATVSGNIHDVHLEFKDSSGVSTSRTYSFDRTGGCGGTCRVGPHIAEHKNLQLGTDTTPLQNQCVFVRTMNLTRAGEMKSDASGVHSQMESAKGPPEFPSQHGDFESSFMQSNSSAGGSLSGHMPNGFNTRQLGVSDMHPSNLLHKLILEKHPDAKMVITRDTDWISVIRDDDTTIPDPQELFARISKVQDLCEINGIITLNPKLKQKWILDPVPPAVPNTSICASAKWTAQYLRVYGLILG